jgi:hypothetical protein
MEDFTEAFSKYFLPVVTLSVMVVILTFFTKKVVELAYPAAKKQKQVGDIARPSEGTYLDSAKPGKAVVSVSTYSNSFARWWNEVILYAIPVVWGALAALVGGSSEWLFPGFDTVGVKVMFGCGAGWFSSFFYKIIRKMVLKKTGVDIQPGSIRLPPPAAGT